MIDKGLGFAALFQIAAPASRPSRRGLLCLFSAPKAGGRFIVRKARYVPTPSLILRPRSPVMAIYRVHDIFRGIPRMMQIFRPNSNPDYTDAPGFDLFSLHGLQSRVTIGSLEDTYKVSDWYAADAAQTWWQLDMAETLPGTGILRHSIHSAS